MGNSEIANKGFLSNLQKQLDVVIKEMKDLKEEDLIHWEAMRKIIDMKVEEDDFKRHFKALQDFILALGKLDFSRRIDVKNRKDLFSYLGVSLNLLAEELEEKVFPLELLETAMNEMMRVKPDFAIITNVYGQIKFVSKNNESLIGFSKEDLINNYIQNFLAVNVHFITFQETFEDRLLHLVNLDSQLIEVKLSMTELQQEDTNNVYFLYAFRETGHVEGEAGSDS